MKKVVPISRPLEQLDFHDSKIVEIVVRDDSRVVWVNVDGVCRLRVCRIEKLVVTDQRKKRKEMSQ